MSMKPCSMPHPSCHRRPSLLIRAISALLLTGTITADASAQPFPASIDLSSLDGNNGFRVDGPANSAQLGAAVAGVGDINGDGFDDALLGAPGNRRVFVIYGRGDGTFPHPFPLASLNGNNGFQFLGDNSSHFFGGSVAAAGDVNGDGLGDLLVGTASGNSNGSNSGSGYLLLGRSSGFAASEALPLTGGNGFAIHGEASGDRFGLSVNGVGDHNGDGFADLLIGAPEADANGNRSGTSYLLFGHADGFPATLALSSLTGDGSGFRLIGTAPDDFSGWSVSGANDVNGDGFADFIIGGKANRSYVVFGKADSFSVAVDLSALDGSNGFRVDGAVLGDFAGFAVGAGGDLNADGFADLLIGAPAVNNAGIHRGSGYVVFGHAGTFPTSLALTSLNGSNGFRLDGGQDNEQVGFSLHAGGDINDDGVDDLLIGAPTADTAFSDVGRVYVVFGRADGNFPQSLPLADLNGNDGFRINGIDANNSAGFAVADVGDINADGVSDLVIGTPFAGANGLPLSGSSYVVFGRKDRLFTDGFEP